MLEPMRHGYAGYGHGFYHMGPGGHGHFPPFYNGVVVYNGAGLSQLLALLLLVFCIAMAIDCFRNSRWQGSAKVLWLLFIFFVPWIGALTYFFLGRPQRTPISYYQPPSIPYYQPQPQAREGVTRQYQQGYQARQQTQAPSQRYEPVRDWQHYEEPQAAYPDIPLQEEQTQS